MQRALSTAALSFPQSFLVFPQRLFAPPYISLNLHLAKCGISLLSPPSRSIAFFFFFLIVFQGYSASYEKVLTAQIDLPFRSLGHVFSVCLYSFRRAVAFVRPF